MIVPLIFHTGLQLLSLHLFSFLFNHLVNIPLALIFGVGKYAAFCVAVVIDGIQMVMYHNVLTNTRLGRKAGWLMNKKMLRKYHKPELMTYFHHSWAYVGVMLLSLLPVYLGGMFPAVFTAHALKMKKSRAYTFIFAGSIIGCFIWTIGAWTVLEFVFRACRR